MARSSSADVLEKFRFGVTWLVPGAEVTELDVDGKSIVVSNTINLKAGFHDVQMPKRNTNVVQYREGLDPDIYSKSAGLSTMEDIVLSRGLIKDGDAFSEFAAWATQVHSSGSTDTRLAYNRDKTKLATGDDVYRKDVLIFMFDRVGDVARAWTLYNAFPVGYVSGSDLSASEDGEKSLEQLTLAYEDFLEVQPGEDKTIPSDLTPILV
jgi:phage tail-like protein